MSCPRIVDGDVNVFLTDCSAATTTGGTRRERCIVGRDGDECYLNACCDNNDLYKKLSFTNTEVVMQNNANFTMNLPEYH